MNSDPNLEFELHELTEILAPSVPMAVFIGDNRVISDSQLEAFVVQNAPRVHIGGQRDEYHTLVIIELGAPDLNEEHFTEHVSWIVTNILGMTSAAQGTEVVPYVGPNPLNGMFHCCALWLYKQQAQLNDVETVSSRVSFDLDGFTNNHNLGNPVGRANFYVRKQDDGRNGRA